MIDLVETLLPNLPDELLWVKGVLYIFLTIILIYLIILPFITIFKIIKERRNRRI